MKILVIAQRVPYPPNKGEKIRTYHQIAWLCDQGHEVSVAVPTGAKQDEADLQALSQALNITVYHGQLPPTALRFLRGFVQGLSLSEANFASAALRETVASIIDSGAVDLVMLSASSLLPYARPAYAGKRCAVFMDFMDLDSDKWAQYAEKATQPKRWVYQRESNKVARLEREAAQHCQACFFIAQAEIDLFNERQPGSSIYSLGNGIDSSAYYPSPQGLRDTCDNDPVLLFVGAMDYAPNVDAVEWFVEEAWQQIRARYPQARFIIAGMNPSPAVQALTQVAGVEVTGFVPEILPYFHQADVFVAPFRNARGVQNKVLQSFACGLPTVSTAMGVEGIACQAGEHFLVAETSDAFVRQVGELIEDAAQRKTLGAAASGLIQNHYSWEAQLATLGEHLEHTLEQVKT